ncbi:cyclase family protein [Cryobacterium sp. TMS1-13-1]|uniref:cyclase family protein n=1 Tax=Cryobacterium sp. TMS1-13-1 TaxID=1259220 RepID=UPI00106DCB95|nr:cyclase family protein [Cryobacterium sp. TMS1-13-1]TFD22534.1 cyclase family protein [Cryobacterium sp. TMS1-13-1]
MIPAFDDLPEIGTIGIKHSWGVLPVSLGTLAFLSPAATLEASHAVRTGETISLNVPFDDFAPPLFGRPSLGHLVTETGKNTFEDTLNDFNPQSASQWDGLTHIRAREFGFYGGITDGDEARTTLGMHHWAQHGIVGRGLLVDVVRYRAAQNIAWDPFVEDAVEASEIADIIAWQGQHLQPGDILCVRTGWMGEYRRRASTDGDVSRVGDQFAGIASTEAMARFLWDNKVAAVASDNPAVESAPGDPRNGSLHRRLIPGLGFALAELLDLDALADRCFELNAYDFLFSAAPLPLTGGASSTANALAIL